MSAIDQLRRKKGRTLSIISGGIIIYISAGGEFTPDGTLIFGSVKFEHTEILELATLVLFVWFNYRLILSNRGQWKKFKRGVLTLMEDDKGFNSYIEKLSKKWILNKASEFNWDDKKIKSATGNLNLESQETIVIKGYQKQVNVKFLDEQENVITTQNIDVPWVYFKLYKLKNWLKHIFTDERFGDYFLPLLLSVIAAIMIIFEAYQ